MLDTTLDLQFKNNANSNTSNNVVKETVDTKNSQKVNPDKFQSTNSNGNLEVQKSESGGIFGFLGGLIKTVVRFAAAVVQSISDWVSGKTPEKEGKDTKINNKTKSKQEIQNTAETKKTEKIAKKDKKVIPPESKNSNSKVITTENTNLTKNSQPTTNKVLENVSFADSKEVQEVSTEKAIDKNLNAVDTLQALHEAELETVPKNIISEKVIDSKYILGKGVPIPNDKIINYASPKDMPKLIVVPPRSEGTTINLAKDGYVSTVKEPIVYKDASGKLIDAYIFKIFPFKEPLNERGYMEPIHVIAANDAKFTIHDAFGHHEFAPKQKNNNISKIKETTDNDSKTKLMSQSPNTNETSQSNVKVTKLEKPEEVTEAAPFELKYDPDIPSIRVIDFSKEEAKIKIGLPVEVENTNSSKIKIKETPTDINIQSSSSKESKPYNYIDSVMDAYINNGRFSSWEDRLDNPQAKLPKSITVGQGIEIPENKYIEFKTQDSLAPITLIPADTKGLKVELSNHEFYTSINRWTYFYDAEGNRKEGQVVHIYRSGSEAKLPNGDDKPAFIIIENGAEVSISNGKYSKALNFPADIQDKDAY